jgi:predicted PurR-regulated permease PerM
MQLGSGGSRGRVAWWLAVLALAALLTYVLLDVVGTLALGVFVYYVVRPLNERVARHLPSDAAASVTFVGVVVPLVAVVGYVVAVAARELLAAFGGRSEPVSSLVAPYLGLESLSGARQTAVEAALDRPLAVVSANSDVARRAADALLALLGAASGVLFVLFVAGAVAYFLLQDGDRCYRWCHEYLFAEESVLDAYLRAVDRDLETVYLGNVFSVGLVAVGAAVVYNAYNLLAPAAVEMPIPTALALATGLASFVPIVVGKLVYVPLTGGLSVAALRTDPGLVAYPVGLFLVALVCLDIVPQTVVRPYLSGRDLHTGATMLSYVLGATVFGWYGLFVGPLVLVLVVQAARIVLPELVDGRELTPTVSGPAAVGSDPPPAGDAVAEADDGS